MTDRICLSQANASNGPPRERKRNSRRITPFYRKRRRDVKFPKKETSRWVFHFVPVSFSLKAWDFPELPCELCGLLLYMYRVFDGLQKKCT